MDGWSLFFSWATLISSTFVGIALFRATSCSPLKALIAQKKLEGLEEKQKRKLHIFSVLMATRGNRLSSQHVEALNMIDIEFYGEVEVLDAWNFYRAELNLDIRNYDKKQQDEFYKKRDSCFFDLLYEMSKLLNYNFDKSFIQNGKYAPIAHESYQMETAKFRALIIELLEGKRPLSVVSAATSINIKSEISVPEVVTEAVD